MPLKRKNECQFDTSPCICPSGTIRQGDACVLVNQDKVTVTLEGPSQVHIGSPIEYDIRIKNNTSEPITEKYYIRFDIHRKLGPSQYSSAFTVYSKQHGIDVDIPANGEFYYKADPGYQYKFIGAVNNTALIGNTYVIRTRVGTALSGDGLWDDTAKPLDGLYEFQIAQ